MAWGLWTVHARRSTSQKACGRRPAGPLNTPLRADVAELADALDLGSSAARRAGSTPAVRTSPSPYCQPLDEASAATSLVGRAIRPFCVIRTS